MESNSNSPPLPNFYNSIPTTPFQWRCFTTHFPSSTQSSQIPFLIGQPSNLGQISFCPIFPWLDGFVEMCRLVSFKELIDLTFWWNFFSIQSSPFISFPLRFSPITRKSLPSPSSRSYSERSIKIIMSLSIAVVRSMGRNQTYLLADTSEEGQETSKSNRMGTCCPCKCIRTVLLWMERWSSQMRQQEGEEIQGAKVCRESESWVQTNGNRHV